MRKKTAFITAFLLVLFVIQTQAQLKYTGYFNAGYLLGSNSSKIQLQTIHGVKNFGWFAGAGLGIDDYFQQSIPVFIDVRKEILNKPNTPFVYVDGGVNITTKGTEEYGTKTKLKSGILLEGGAGYRIDLNKIALNIAAGYSYKTYSQEKYNRLYLPNPPYITDDYIKSSDEKFSLQRFVMKVGIEF